MKYSRICRKNLLAVTACAALLSACADPQNRNAAPVFDAPALPEDLEIIDVHTHTGFSEQVERRSGVVDSEQGYRDALRRANAVAAVSHTPSGRTTVPSLPGLKVLHCAGVGERIDVPALERLLQRDEFGCIKIYLGYVFRYANDPQYAPVYRLAARYEVPVVFHTGDTYSTSARVKFADPLPIDDVAVEHPDVTFVIAHLGNPWIQSAAEVAYKNANVYIEASALLIGDLSDHGDEAVERYLVDPIRWAFGYIEDPSKFMFGSDWPLIDIEPYARAYAQAIPQEHWQAVFHDNALRVFPKLR